MTVSESKKDKMIKVRVRAGQGDLWEYYAASHSLTVSQMIRMLVDWAVEEQLIDEWIEQGLDLSKEGK